MNQVFKHSDGCPDDPAYLQALALVVETGEASVSLIQRKCNIGYNHAGTIVEWMECMGYISSFDGRTKRKVYMTKEQFAKIYGPIDESSKQDALPAWEREEKRIKKMIGDAPQKREDMPVTLGGYSAFGF